MSHGSSRLMACRRIASSERSREIDDLFGVSSLPSGYNHTLIMDFDQLVTFLQVAKLGSFSRAGEKVFRSQSAVSSQIRLLEQEYGDKLLDCSGKSVRLTPAGRVLFAYSERLIRLRDESLLAVADQG